MSLQKWRVKINSPILFRNKDLKNQVRNLSRVRKDKLELNTRVLDLEKQIYETRETYETYETQAEDELKKGKQVNPRYALRHGDIYILLGSRF